MADINFTKFVKLAKLEGKKFLIVEIQEGGESKVYTTESVSKFAIMMGSALAGLSNAVYLSSSAIKKYSPSDILNAMLFTAVPLAEKELKNKDAA
jgi:hypothetical protein